MRNPLFSLRFFSYPIAADPSLVLTREVEPDQLSITQPGGAIIVLLEQGLTNYCTWPQSPSSCTPSGWSLVPNQPMWPLCQVSSTPHFFLLAQRLLSCIPGSSVMTEDDTWCSFRAIYQAGLNIRAWREMDFTLVKQTQTKLLHNGCQWCSQHPEMLGWNLFVSFVELPSGIE